MLDYTHQRGHGDKLRSAERAATAAGCQIPVATARSDATAHRLARIAFMAKYAQAMPIARNAAAGIAKTTMFAPLSHRPDEPDFI